ncbi:MAG: glycosyltransferase family 4 protein [Deltaproteobacteria bacterium]|jgi:glycosyltransferase involved in cell wall biosynthesis|nr:glycosyltransferase family 4 protein [Deltaproteobacteria bacterium]
MLKIGFYTEGLPFEGDSLEKGALGGSETAFIEIARALARQGHEVLAFNNCAKAGEHRGVSYHPFKVSLPLLASAKFDVFVVSRFFGFFNLPIKAALKVLWNHDTLENPKALRAIQDEIDICFVLSKFHRDNYLTRIPQLDDRVVLTRNGLNLDLLDQGALKARRDPQKIIYCSRPERGLKLLLEEIWPRLLSARPLLRLYLCGYNPDRENLAPGLSDLYDYLDFLIAREPSVISLGALKKVDFYRHLREASLLAYPCVFPEISCIVALEAQALGTPILTSAAYALPETVVTPSFLTRGKPGSREYVQDFVEKALNLLSGGEETARLAQEAQKIIRAQYSWDSVAREWTRVFALSLKSRQTRRFLEERSVGVERDAPLA